MEEGQSLVQKPYFIWSIEDICSKSRVCSPIFTVNDVKFRMAYSTDLVMCKIRIEPEDENPQSDVDYCFGSSVSVTFTCNPLLDTHYTFKMTIGNNLPVKSRNIIWMLEEQKFYKLVNDMQGENTRKDVKFLCVFGPLSKCLKDDINSDGNWYESHCLERLATSIKMMSLNANSNILLKCGKEEIVAHEDVLSARSGKFADMFRNKTMTKKEVEITDMTFEVLDNFINYIYSGRLKDDEPSEDLLIQLYETAIAYKVWPLKIMASCRLEEILENAMINGYEDPSYREQCHAISRKFKGIAQTHSDDEFRERIYSCLKKCLHQYPFGDN